MPETRTCFQSGTEAGTFFTTGMCGHAICLWKCMNMRPNWTITADGCMKDLTVTFGYRMSTTAHGGRTTTEDGSGTPSAGGLGAPTSHGGGVFPITGGGTGESVSGGIGFRPHGGALPGYTGTRVMTTSAGVR